MKMRFLLTLSCWCTSGTTCWRTRIPDYSELLRRHFQCRSRERQSKIRPRHEQTIASTWESENRSFKNSYWFYKFLKFTQSLLLNSKVRFKTTQNWWNSDVGYLSGERFPVSSLKSAVVLSGSLSSTLIAMLSSPFIISLTIFTGNKVLLDPFKLSANFWFFS